LEEFNRSLVSLELIEKRMRESSDKPLSLTPHKILSIMESDPQCLDQLGFADSLTSIKSVLLEEICDMALPVILDNGKNYIQMAQMRKTNQENFYDIKLLTEKINLLIDSPYISYLTEKTPPGYGFISYPGYLFVQSRKFIEKFPGNPETYFPYAYPVIYELEVTRFRDNTTPGPGWLVFPFINPSRTMDTIDCVKGKILEAVKSVELLNGQLASLGGLCASLTSGGTYVDNRTSIKVTTGHSYTIANIMNTMDTVIVRTGLRLKDAVVAVVGAAGSIGSGFSRMCAARGIKKLILIDTRDLEETRAMVNQISEVPVAIGDIDRNLSEAHIVLVATNTPDIIFCHRHFRNNAIILDDSQPKNIGKDLMQKRDDIILLEAGAVQPPADCQYKIHKAFGSNLKNFRWQHINIQMAGIHEVPSCLAEVMIWQMLGEKREQYSLGKADPDLAEFLNNRAKTLGFREAPLQSFGKQMEKQDK